MKKIIITALLILYASTAAAWDKHGPAWKIQDGVVSPGVSATSVDFTGYSTSGLTLSETDPVSMPVLANVSSQLNSLESTFSAYTSTAGESHTAYLSYEDAEGFFEDYSTADIYYKWQNNINDSESFGNMSASAIDGSITILPGGDGVYQISRNTGMHGQPEAGYSFAIFKNETAISESHTSPGIPNRSLPFFTNLSSYTGDAVYGNNSTIDFLFYPDKDQIDIVEAGTGNGVDQWCFEYEMHFKIKHLPDFLSLGNIQYTGGSGHFADGLAFDNWSSEWDNLRVATGDIANAGSQADYKNENIAFHFPNGGDKGRYVLDGVVKTKLRHNDSVVCSSGHTLWIDQASVTDLLGVRSDSTTIIRELAAGDKITIREMPDIANKLFHRHKTILNISRIGDLDT